MVNIQTLTHQKRLLHGFNKTFQVMFNIVHNNVDFIHVTSHNNLLKMKDKSNPTLEKFSTHQGEECKECAVWYVI